MDVVEEDIEVGGWICSHNSRVLHKVAITPKNKRLDCDALDLTDLSKYPHRFEDINPYTFETDCSIYNQIEDIRGYFEGSEHYIIKSSIYTLCPSCSDNLESIVEWD